VTFNQIELGRYERNLTIEQCVLSKEKNLFTLANNQITELELIKSIFKLTQRFLLANFSDSQIDATANQFALDIIDLRRDWNLDDIIMFFKFIRQRQDIPELKTYGGKITAIKLIEFSGIYENERCEVKEQFLSNQKKVKVVKSDSDETVNKLFATFGKELQEKQNTAIEKERKDKIERAVKTNQYHKENEDKLRELKELLDKGEINDIELAKRYNNFLIRKQ
jgi:hypothetical protein